MSLFFPRTYAGPAGRSRGLGGIASALSIHGLLLLLAFIGFGQVERLDSAAPPIAVRLLEESPPSPSAAAPLPLPVRRQVSRQPVKPRPLPVLAAAQPDENSSFYVPMPAAVPVVAHAAPAAVPAEPWVEASFDADYLSNPKPPYPRASRQLGESGTVYLRVHVGPDGLALKVELKSSSGFPRLDQSALDTVAGWRFVPARRGSREVAAWVVVPIIFALS